MGNSVFVLEAFVQGGKHQTKSNISRPIKNEPYAYSCE